MTELESLLRKQWIKSDGSPDETMVKYCLKSSSYIDTGPYYINVGDKPSIESTMYYDDETEGPDASKFEAFRDYNMRDKRFDIDALIADNRHIWIYTNYTNDRTGGKLKGWSTTRLGDEPTHLGEYHKATEDDIKAIRQVLKEMEKQFEKRLATYWKRYSNKVYAHGYWANR